MALRVGIVGCGLWGRNILRDLLAEGADAVVADPLADARALALSIGASRAVPRLADLPELDGLVVATPASTHGAVIDEALARGVPVFAEKPLTTDPESAERLARQAPDRLFVMHVFRYHPGVSALGAIARGGELGPVVSLRSTRVHWGTSRTDVDCVWTLVPHDLSVAIEVLGEVPRPRGALAELVNGRVTGMSGWLGERPGFLFEASTRQRQRRRELRLHCEGGTALIRDCDGGLIEVWRDTATAPEARRFALEPTPLRRELRSFVSHLAGGPPPPTGAAEGALVVHRVAELRRLAGLT